MIEFINEKIVKTRKTHQCHGCGDLIESGTSNILCQLLVEDVIYRLYYCNNCQLVLKKYCYKCKECFELENSTLGFILLAVRPLPSGRGYKANYVSFF
jgi:hypothetical protein